MSLTPITKILLHKITFELYYLFYICEIRMITHCQFDLFYQIFTLFIVFNFAVLFSKEQFNERCYHYSSQRPIEMNQRVHDNFNHFIFVIIHFLAIFHQLLPVFITLLNDIPTNNQKRTHVVIAIFSFFRPILFRLIQCCYCNV